MSHHEPQGLLANLDEIHAVLVTSRIDVEFAAVGIKFIDLLTEGVVDAHRAKVFTLQGHEVVGGIGNEGVGKDRALLHPEQCRKVRTRQGFRA